MSTAAEFRWTAQDSKTELCPLFDCAPLALAQCQRRGDDTALNPALKRMLGGRSSLPPCLCFGDFIHPQDRTEGERFFRELFERQRDNFQIDSKARGPDSRPLRWTAWRVRGTNGEPDHALVLAEDDPHDHQAVQRLQQAEKLEAVGRLPEVWLTTLTIFSLECGCTATCSWPILSHTIECESTLKKFGKQACRLRAWSASYSRWSAP